MGWTSAPSNSSSLPELDDDDEEEEELEDELEEVEALEEAFSLALASLRRRRRHSAHFEEESLSHWQPSSLPEEEEGVSWTVSEGLPEGSTSSIRSSFRR